jgi:hypothetical protein
MERDIERINLKIANLNLSGTFKAMEVTTGRCAFCIVRTEDEKCVFHALTYETGEAFVLGYHYHAMTVPMAGTF